MSTKKTKRKQNGDFRHGWGFAWDLKRDCGCIFCVTPEEVKNFRRRGQIRPLVMFVAAGTQIEVRGLKSLWEARNKNAKSLVKGAA